MFLRSALNDEGRHMRDCWVFFHDVFGHWQWERHRADMLTVATSSGSFADPDACRDDAIRHGYQSTIHDAIFPAEFEQASGSVSRVRTGPFDTQQPSLSDTAKLNLHLSE